MSIFRSLLGRAKESPLEAFDRAYAQLSWTPDETKNSLEKLWTFADAYGRRQLRWYRRHAGMNRLTAIVFRIVAIGGAVGGVTLQIFAATGVIVATGDPAATGDLAASPPAPATGNAAAVKAEPITTVELTQYSYIAFALAGAAVLADRWIGSSAAWLRHTNTWLALTKELTEFRFDWALATRKLDEALATKPIDPKAVGGEVESMVTLLRQFVDRVHEQVRQETEVWAKNFEQITEELSKRVKTEAEATKPGSITVKVTEEGRLKEPLTISLDHRDQGDLSGDSHLITSVTPGPHTVAVRGRELSLPGQPAGKEIVASEVVNLAPGANVTVQLKLVSSVKQEE